MENKVALKEVKVKKNPTELSVLFNSTELDLSSIPEKEKEVFIEFLEHQIYDVMLPKKRQSKKQK